MEKEDDMPSPVKPKGRTDGSLAAPGYTSSAGLCSTCIHAQSCVYREARGGDAQYCELFEVGNGSHPTPTVSLVTKVKSDAGAKPKQSTLRGLCVNCENRDTCTLPKAEGGVWHCEEYR